MSKRADDPALTVTLPRLTWAALLGLLYELPYGRAASFIVEIERQGNAQLEAPEHQADEARAN